MQNIFVSNIILGNGKGLWEKEIYKFAKVNQLRAVAEYLPCTEYDSLSPYVYEMVLYEFLKNDPEVKTIIL